MELGNGILELLFKILHLLFQNFILYLTLPSCYCTLMSDTKTSWGAVAEWYDELLETDTDSYQKNVLMPNLIRLIEPKPGMHILDIGCGQGYFARAFARNGATVTACDISRELIAKAKAHATQVAEQGSKAATDVAFHVAPSDTLSFMPDQSVDLITIILALQNIENLVETIAECARVSKPGARLMIVLNHPAFRIPRKSSWQWQSSLQPGSNGAEIEYRRLDSYLSEERIKIDMTPGEKDEHKKKYTYSFHRPLQSYVKALSKNGYAISRLEEWISHKKSQKGPRSAEEDRMRKEIPMFMVVEAKKG